MLVMYEALYGMALGYIKDSIPKYDSLCVVQSSREGLLESPYQVEFKGTRIRKHVFSRVALHCMEQIAPGDVN